MAQQLDTSKLIPLDVSGLVPLDEEPKLDTSKLVPLDTSGLIPLDDEPQGKPINLQGLVSNQPFGSAGPEIPPLIARPEYKNQWPETSYLRTPESGYTAGLADGQEVVLSLDGKSQQLAKWNAKSGNFEFESTEVVQGFRPNPSAGTGMGSMPYYTPPQRVPRINSIAPDKVLGYTNAADKVDSAKVAFARSIIPTAAGFSGFAGGSALTAAALGLAPETAGFSLLLPLLGGGVGGFFGGMGGQALQDKMFPIDKEQQLALDSNPNTAGIAGFAPALIGAPTSPRTWLNLASKEAGVAGAAARQLGTNAAMMGALGTGNDVGANLVAGNPAFQNIGLGSVLHHAGTGLLLGHPNKIGRAMEFPGRMAARGYEATFPGGKPVAPPTSGTMPDLDAAAQAADPAPAPAPAPAPVAPDPAAPAPAPATVPSAPQGNVPPRPGRINGDASARDAWDEQYGESRKGGRTHNNDGTPFVAKETEAEVSTRLFNDTIDSQETARSLGFSTVSAAAQFAKDVSNLGWKFDQNTKSWYHPDKPGKGFSDALAEWRSGVNPRPKRENYSSADEFEKDAKIWDRDHGRNLDPLTGKPKGSSSSTEPTILDKEVTNLNERIRFIKGELLRRQTEAEAEAKAGRTNPELGKRIERLKGNLADAEATLESLKDRNAPRSEIPTPKPEPTQAEIVAQKKQELDTVNRQLEAAFRRNADEQTIAEIEAEQERISNEYEDARVAMEQPSQPPKPPQVTAREQKPVVPPVEQGNVPVREAAPVATTEASQKKEPQGIKDARAQLAKLEASGNGDSAQAKARRKYIRNWEKQNGLPSSVEVETPKPKAAEPAANPAAQGAAQPPKQVVPAADSWTQSGKDYSTSDKQGVIKDQNGNFIVQRAAVVDSNGNVKSYETIGFTKTIEEAKKLYADKQRDVVENNERERKLRESRERQQAQQPTATKTVSVNGVDIGNVPVKYKTRAWDKNAGKAVDQEGESGAVEFAGRVIVLRNVNGVQVPFYLSTGEGGKTNVPSGKWYPFFGVADGWLNKMGSRMADYYGRSDLATVARHLDETIGDIRDKTGKGNFPVIGDKQSFEHINRGLSPIENGLENTRIKLQENMDALFARLDQAAAAKAQPKPATEGQANPRSSAEIKPTESPQGEAAKPKPEGRTYNIPGEGEVSERRYLEYLIETRDWNSKWNTSEGRKINDKLMRDLAKKYGVDIEAEAKRLAEKAANEPEPVEEDMDPAESPTSDVGLVRNEGFNPEEVNQLRDLGLQSMKKQLADIEAAGRGESTQAKKLRETIAAREKKTGQTEQPKEQPNEQPQKEEPFGTEIKIPEEDRTTFNPKGATDIWYTGDDFFIVKGRNGIRKGVSYDEVKRTMPQLVKEADRLRAGGEDRPPSEQDGRFPLGDTGQGVIEKLSIDKAAAEKQLAALESNGKKTKSNEDQIRRLKKKIEDIDESIKENDPFWRRAGSDSWNNSSRRAKEVRDARKDPTAKTVEVEPYDKESVIAHAKKTSEQNGNEPYVVIPEKLDAGQSGETSKILYKDRIETFYSLSNGKSISVTKPATLAEIAKAYGKSETYERSSNNDDFFFKNWINNKNQKPVKKTNEKQESPEELQRRIEELEDEAAELEDSDPEGADDLRIQASRLQEKLDSMEDGEGEAGQGAKPKPKVTPPEGGEGFTVEHKKGKDLESKPQKGTQSFLGKNDAIEIKDSNGNVIGESILLGDNNERSYWGVDFKGTEGRGQMGNPDIPGMTAERLRAIQTEALKQVIENEVKRSKANPKSEGVLNIRSDLELISILGLPKNASAADIARAFKKQFGMDMIDSWFPLAVGREGTSGNTRPSGFVVDLGTKNVKSRHGSFSENRISPSDGEQYVKQNTEFKDLYSGKEPKPPQLRDAQEKNAISKMTGEQLIEEMNRNYSSSPEPGEQFGSSYKGGMENLNKVIDRVEALYPGARKRIMEAAAKDGNDTSAVSLESYVRGELNAQMRKAGRGEAKAPEEPAEKKYPIDKFEDALGEKGLKVLRRNNTEDFVAEGGVEDNGRQRPTIVVGDTKVTLSSEGIELVNGKVLVMDGQETDASGNVIYTIERIVTDANARGTGSASKAIAEVTAAADKAGLTLQLEPTPFRSLVGKGKSLTKEQLVEWYKRNGFEQKNEGSDAILIRKPKAQETTTGRGEPTSDTQYGVDVGRKKIKQLEALEEKQREIESRLSDEDIADIEFDDPKDFLKKAGPEYAKIKSEIEALEKDISENHRELWGKKNADVLEHVRNGIKEHNDKFEPTAEWIKNHPGVEWLSNSKKGFNYDPKSKNQIEVILHEGISFDALDIPDAGTIYSHHTFPKGTPIETIAEFVRDRTRIDPYSNPSNDSTNGSMLKQRIAEVRKEMKSGEAKSKAEEWADNTIKEIGRQGRRNSGLDPELLAAYAVKGAIKFGRSLKDFAEFSREMVKEFGDGIKPHLKAIFDKANDPNLAKEYAISEQGRAAANQPEPDLSKISADMAEQRAQERENTRQIAQGQKPELSAGGKAWRSVVDHPIVAYAKYIGMRMRTVADLNPQSETAQRVVNDFSLIPGTKETGPDFNTAHTNQLGIFFNKFSQALGPVLSDYRKMSPADKAKFSDLFIRAVEGRLPREVGGETGEAVKRFRKVMEELHQYGLDAGLEIGKVTDYFPRGIDADAVQANRAGFEEAAAKAYERQWERQQKEGLGAQSEFGFADGQTKRPNFKEMARKWADAIILGHEGLDFERSIFEEGNPSTKENFQKERQFTKDEAALFDAFRDKDFETVVTKHVGNSVRRAEVARRLGADGNKWGEVASKMSDEGVSPEHIAELKEMIQTNLGVSKPADKSNRTGRKAAAALDVYNLISTSAFLKATGLLNLAEATGGGLRSADPVRSFKDIFTNLARVRNVMTRTTPEQSRAMRTEIERIYGQGYDLAGALAIELGINRINHGLGSISSGYHLDGGSDRSGAIRQSNDAVYRLYGIHATEMAKRETSLVNAMDFMDNTVKMLDGESNLQRIFKAAGKDIKADTLAKDRLMELGVKSGNIDGVTKFIRELRGLDADAQLKKIMSDDPMAIEYRKALTIFNKQASVQATPASRTQSANESSFGKVLFQFQTFANEWTAQHGRYMAEQAKKIIKNPNDRYSVAERLMAAGTAPAFAVSVAAMAGIRALVNAITGFEVKDDGKVPVWVKTAADAFVYTGILGPTEILYKAGIREQMPLGVLGEWIKNGLQVYGRLKENPESDAAQRAGTKMAYRSAAVPATNTGLAVASTAADTIPNPLLRGGVKLAAAGAAQMVANNRVENAIADEVAGDDNTKGAPRYPRRPTPPAPPAR